MIITQNIQIKDKRLSSFFQKHSGFDILTFNFLNKIDLDSLKLGNNKTADSTLELLKSYQRVLRLFPNPEIGKILIQSGLDSSLKITELNRGKFIAEQGAKFGVNGDHIAAEIYNSATAMRSKVMHAVAAVNSISASSHNTALTFNNISADLKGTFQDLSSYQDYFGDLDYCDCSECKSIFGAAAYLVDLLRIIDKEITQANASIEDGLHFFDRRPDIKTIELTCENTNSLVPYLQIVNNLLSSILSKELEATMLDNDLELSLANTYYPQNLPINIPFEKLQIAAKQQKTNLGDIRLSLTPGQTIDINSACAILNLSYEQLKNLEKQDAKDLATVVSSNYGTPVSAQSLNNLDEVIPFLGATDLNLKQLNQLLIEDLDAQEQFNVAAKYTTTGIPGSLLLFQNGSDISGTYGTDGKLKGSINGTKVRGEWSSLTQAPPAVKGDFEFDFSADGSSFTGKWSKGLGEDWETTAWNGTPNDPYVQGIIPHSLFINGTLDANQFLQINSDKIAGQSIGTLDRLNRFIRWTKLLNVSFTDFNWLLTSLGVIEIDDSLVIELGKTFQCKNDFNLDLEILCSSWFDIRTIGRGNGPESIAPFDLLFNSKEMIDQLGQTYHPKIAASPFSFVNPLYQDVAFELVLNPTEYKNSNPNSILMEAVAKGEILIQGLPASQKDIVLLGQSIFGTTDITVQLTVSNLSALYRHIQMAKKLNIRIDQYILLCRQLGLGTVAQDIFTLSPILDRDQVFSLMTKGSKVLGLRLNVYEIEYICYQTSSKPVSSFVNSGYKQSTLPDFTDQVKQTLKPTLCSNSSYAIQNLTKSDSGQIVFSLNGLGIIDSNGLVVKDPETITNANWKNIFIGKLLTNFDFEGGNLSKTDSETILTDLKAQKIVNETGLIIKALSAIDWTAIKVGTPPLNLTSEQQDFVLSTLNTQQRNLSDSEQNLVKDFTKALETKQKNAFYSQLGTLFNVKSDLVSLAVEVAAQTNPNYLELFFEESSNIQLEAIQTFVLDVSKPLMLYRSKSMNQDQFELFCKFPKSFGLVGDGTYHIDGLIQAQELALISNDFGDTQNELIQYFKGIWEGEPVDSLQNDLCKLTNWNLQQYQFIIDAIISSSKGCQTVADVQAVRKVFGFSESLGIDPVSMSNIVDTASLPATTANWSAYKSVSSQLLLSCKNKPGSSFKAIQGSIDGMKRDAMVPISIWLLGGKWSGITTPTELYEFLLIDPEMGGCKETSLIEEAMNSAQLYLQRCRLNLEKEVSINTDDIPDVWWEWMMDYRVWEVNREIFVYPENYIDPSLRKSSTQLFIELENKLMQGNIDKGTVKSAYVKYLDDLSQITKLHYVDAYQTVVHDKERGAIDTQFLFARTREQPFHFYYLRKEKVGNCENESDYLWSEWDNIDIKINSEHVTPIYAFNKLFVFWTERTDSKHNSGLKGETGGSTDIKSNMSLVTKISIKYSYYNFNGKWVQPQTLLSEQVVDVINPDQSLYGPFRKYFADASSNNWDRVSIINTRSENYLENGGLAPEKLIVYFGPLASPSDLGVIPLAPDIRNDSFEAYEFKKMLETAYFNLENMKLLNRKGQIPICSHHIIDETMMNQVILQEGEYLILGSNQVSEYMSPTFSVGYSDQRLLIKNNYDTIAQNSGDWKVDEFLTVEKGPATVSADSFVTVPYINEDLSSNIYNGILSKMPNFLNGGKITSDALEATVAVIATNLNISLSYAKLVQNRFFELYYGSLEIFSNVASNASIVPVKNEPSRFILNNNEESFMISTKNYVVETTNPLITDASFESATIDEATSKSYFQFLSTAPNNYINPDGTVNQAMVANANPMVIGNILGIPAPYTEAQNIINVLTTNTTEVVERDPQKLDAQIRISAALFPQSFMALGTDEKTSEHFYNLLSTEPNKYIEADGSVSFEMAEKAIPPVIGPLLGLPIADAETERVVLLLKTASTLLSPNSFVTETVDKATNELYITETQSQSYFKILSTAPNQFILPNGVVDRALLRQTSTYTIALLLGFQKDPDNFAVRKVLNVLNCSGPVSLEFKSQDDLVPANNTVFDYDTIYSLQFNVERISTSAINILSNALNFGGIESALELEVQQAPISIFRPFSYLEPTTKQIAAPISKNVLEAPLITTNQQVAFNGPYGIYYWELFFHSPFLVASILNTHQKFDEAEKWMKYIFNPTEQVNLLTKDAFIAQRPIDIAPEIMESIYPVISLSPNQYIDSGIVTELGKDANGLTLSQLLKIPVDQGDEIANLLKNNYLVKPNVRAWRFNPFRNYDIETLFQNLTDCAQITEYNDDPFNPHAIARLRIGAYEKTIVMKYIDNLLDWGDQQFTMYSRESIGMARLYYSYAENLLGPKPVDMGACSESFPVTFEDISAKYKNGSIPQFLIDMEHLSTSSEGANNTGTSTSSKPYNDLGYYFCIPDNKQLMGYWTRVEDRMYKIQHCLNINGIAEPLPLFEPPIDPMELVRAAASGGNVSGVIGQLGQNLYPYRFKYVIAQAKEYVNMVNSLGNNLLSALEKSDGEALALLHNQQSSQLLNFGLGIKKKQLEGLQKQLDGMQKSQESTVYRKTHYANLISEGLIPAEITSFDLTAAGMELQALSVGINGVAIAGYLLPSIFGFSDGGMKFGDAINMGSSMLGTSAQILTESAGTLQTIAQYQRRSEEWALQEKTAEFQEQQIAQQIEQIQSTIEAKQQEILMQNQEIQQKSDELNFYKTKFTNQQLYQWMVSRISAVYFQAYSMALDMAIVAQSTYQYELDRDDTYISFNYWDSLHKGLLAADGLNLALAQLDNGYYQHHTRRLEIKKTISLKNLNPETFYKFSSGASNGLLPFELTEELFDRDFPGHYCRKIKSVSLTIPAIVGPYQNIHATLTQNTNMVVLEADKDVVNYVIYATAPQKSGTAPNEPTQVQLRQDWASSQQIVLSNGEADTGLFVLNHEDPRYLPFEETGAVSAWTLSMPPRSNRLDFSTISDVILTVNYTAIDGGEAFAANVIELYSGSEEQYQNIYVNSFDFGLAFSNEWYNLFHTKPDPSGIQTLNFGIAKDVVLPNLTGVNLNEIILDLKVEEGIEINTSSGIKLSINGVNVPITFINNQGKVKKSDLSGITNWSGIQWNIAFDTSQVGSICSSGVLDSSKLKNAILFIGYSSDI